MITGVCRPYPSPSFPPQLKRGEQTCSLVYSHRQAQGACYDLCPSSSSSSQWARFSPLYVCVLPFFCCLLVLGIVIFVSHTFSCPPEPMVRGACDGVQSLVCFASAYFYLYTGICVCVCVYAQMWTGACCYWDFFFGHAHFLVIKCLPSLPFPFSVLLCFFPPPSVLLLLLLRTDWTVARSGRFFAYITYIYICVCVCYMYFFFSVVRR